jgi:hypothetical protein
MIIAVRDRTDHVIRDAPRTGAVLNGTNMQPQIALEQKNLPDELLAKELALYYAEPLGFVMAAYPWNQPGTELEHEEGLDENQKQFPVDLGKEVAARTARKLKIDDDSSLDDGFCDFLRAACGNLVTVCDGAIYICVYSAELHALHQAFIAAGGHWSAFIIWAERQLTLGWLDYFRQYQAVLYGWREGSDHHWCGARDQGDVWTIPLPLTKRENPTRNPVELVERAVENSSRRGDTVLDPFAGSGTTLIACERLERKACLIELDPRYADVICERWEQYGGKPAIRNGDCARYAELAQERRKNASKAVPTRRPRK